MRKGGAWKGALEFEILIPNPLINPERGIPRPAKKKGREVLTRKSGNNIRVDRNGWKEKRVKAKKNNPSKIEG